MPSPLHEAIVELFRARPAMAAELLQQTFATTPVGDDARLGESTLTELQPAERRADLVILWGDPTTLAVVLEVQTSRDDDKTWRWLAYVGTLRARHRCAVWLLVVCPDAAIGRWAVAALGPDVEGGHFRHRVIAPADVPWVLDEAAARASPELAMLSALAHGGAGEEGENVVVAAATAINGLPDERARVYHDMLVWLLPKVARQAIERRFGAMAYEFPQSDFAKKWVAMGREEGRARAASFVLRLLAHKIGVVPSPQCDRIAGLPHDALEELGEALLAFRAGDDLARWLADHPEG